jgi:hypothetical protein
MTTYFSVKPAAAGTASVECLSSLLHRLAVAHGVTRHQFITHLRGWWAKQHQKHLPRCEELRWDGYSENVALGLNALCDAIGANYSDCTLVALKDVCAANYIGSVKHYRAWCPACYRDDLAAGGPAYDRLLWRIQASVRCSLHRHILVSNCPYCGSMQKNDTGSIELHRCTSCGQSLASQRDKQNYAPNPSFGEHQIHSLIESLPNLSQIAMFPLQRFLSSVEVDMGKVADDLGDLFHHRTYPARPQLTSLIAVSVYFEIDIVDLLSDPEGTAKRVPLGVGRALPDRKRRPSSLRREERSAWFEQELLQVLRSPPPYPSVRDFCRARDFSHHAAWSNFYSLTSKLSHKYHEWKNQEATRLRRKAISAIRALHEKRSHVTEREFVRIVVERSGAPVHVVRSLLRSS